MTKALQVRNHPSAQRFTDSLVELFDDSDIGWDAARAIGQIVSTDKVLTKKNHAVIKVKCLLLHIEIYHAQHLPISSMRKGSRTSCFLVSWRGQSQQAVSRSLYKALIY